MNSRNISLTPEKAHEWYNKGGELKEIALQAFTEEELKKFSFKNIITFRDAVKALDINLPKVVRIIEQLEDISIATIETFKLNIIKKALNKNYKLELIKNTIYYPAPFFTTVDSAYYDRVLKNGKLVEVAQFTINDKIYRLLGGGVDTFSGLFGCANEEIAKHMSIHFAKDIFEVKYGDTIKYEWL